MAKNVFHPDEIAYDNEVIVLGESEEQLESVPEEIIPEIPPIMGPTKIELEQEAEEFRARWGAERQRLIDEAANTRDEILKSAKADAEQIVADAHTRAAEIDADAEKKVAQKIEEADQIKQDAAQMTKTAEEHVGELEQQAHEKGHNEGYEKGWEAGQQEIQMLTDTLHDIVAGLMKRRSEILMDAETQLVELVIQIAHKVVKIISQENKEVITRNVLEAINKLKTKSDITVRINPIDKKILYAHRQAFASLVASKGKISLVQDNTIEPGGCVIETDMGEIDARISSQLQIIENEVRRVMPVRSRTTLDQ